MNTASSEPLNVGETLAEIRGRVAARLARTVPEIPELALPPLDPLREARSVAEAWTYGIGQLNPRPPGLFNALAQGFKKLLARSLRWFAFPQTQFNAGAVAALIRTEDMFSDLNRNLLVLAQNLAACRRKIEEVESGAQFALGLLRPALDRQDERMSHLETRTEEVSRSVSLSLDEISHSLGRSIEEVSISVSRSLEGMGQGIGALQTAVNGVQEEAWRYREDHVTIHRQLDQEVRELRQSVRAASVGPAVTAPVTAASAATLPTFDYPRFEEKFRGKEAEIRQRQEFYLPLLHAQAPVLDVACGRGEMLELLREKGIAARGVDLDPAMVRRCLDKNLAVERAEALAYLENQADASLGAIFSAQFVEHLPVAAYSRLIELACAKLRPGGRLILETQNPECLAIYSQTFFLDPTHVRPVPAAQLYFLMSEAGFGRIETHYLAPVEDSLPQLPLHLGDETWNAEAARFNRTYFGHMDYAIVGVKP